MNKKNLGLDLGTNSVGWALIENDFEKKEGRILGMGSRIIPMTQDLKDDFGKGNSVSQTAERTQLRGIRRLRERHLLRRERLHRVLNVLGFLPKHYTAAIDFEKRLGQFMPETEPKLVYDANGFIFKSAFEEMLNDFEIRQPQWVANGRKIPYDWTIYYLRKKALTQKIEKEALAWMLLNFNQKRGYYELRGEEEEEVPNKLIEFHSLKVIKVLEDEAVKGKAERWFTMVLENGWEYRRSSKISLFDWKDKVRDFIVTTDLNEDGSIKIDKEGKEKRSFRAPGADDWTLMKKKTEQEIDHSNKTVGAFIYEAILNNPQQKINGKLVRTIERKFYKKELLAILTAQEAFHPELRNVALYHDCIRELYRNNHAYQLVLESKDLVHLLINDIIFYQRPLKSKKSSIGNCSLECRKYKDASGFVHTQDVKAIPKSHPLYQEFRIRQWMYNLSIYLKEDDSNHTDKFLQSPADYENLYKFLSDRKEIKQEPLLKFLLGNSNLKGKALSLEAARYRWNFVPDKEYPCNTTGTQIKTRLEKVDGVPLGFLTREKEVQLWHIIYSVTDKVDFEKALSTFANKNTLDRQSFVDAFKRFPPFPSEYGSFSEKALKKLLPLMRTGTDWDWEALDAVTKDRIEKIINGEYDENIKERVREKSIHLTERNHFQGLQLWLASYIVHNRHSEGSNIEKWNSVTDLTNYLHEFKQHSLRNPIVEQVVTETLRVVGDIWKQFGGGAKDFFNEIHIELGRDMKKTAQEREVLSNKIAVNENTNMRIKALLAELFNDKEVDNVRPYSPMQQEILKIYEEGVLNSNIEIEEEYLKISKMAQPSSSELRRYKLWLEQKYHSPYTGKVIPLNKLFTTEYEVEHIIPQSRYFDDSLSNKVICESAVNKLKDKQLSFEFICNHSNEMVDLGLGRQAVIFDREAYEKFVKTHYANNRTKRNKLLMQEIPNKMIERQLNDARFISKFITGVLSKIVRDEQNDDGVHSKHVLPGNGKITNILKQDWGLNDVWNELILPRFLRMNQLGNTNVFTAWNAQHQKFLPTIPLELSKGFQKKRLDHRHHALDALIIAAATPEHVNLLNNIHANSPLRYDLNNSLRHIEKVSYKDAQTGKLIEKKVPKNFKKAWDSFTEDAKIQLQSMVVSFKQNVRVINKLKHKYEKWVLKEGKPVKEKVLQIKGDNWAIRKDMHKATVYGQTHLRKSKWVSLTIALDVVEDIVNKPLRKHIQSLMDQGFTKKELLKHFKAANNEWNGETVTKLEIYFWDHDQVASRVPLDSSFNLKKIEAITDSGIQKIVRAHLENYKGRLNEKGQEILPEELAFSPEGIEDMNRNIQTLNNGRFHQPIFKVRIYEPKGRKFNVGQMGNKKSKFVEAAKGTNLFFAIYMDQHGKRSYETIPLNIVIERQKQGLGSVPNENEMGAKLLFHLSPNDLVFVPGEEEQMGVDFPKSIKGDGSNIYKMVSATSTACFFVPHSIATVVVDKVELSPLNKMEKTLDGRMIKAVCIKLKVDRIGNISK